MKTKILTKNLHLGDLERIIQEVAVLLNNCVMQYGASFDVLVWSLNNEIWYMYIILDWSSGGLL